MQFVLFVNVFMHIFVMIQRNYRTACCRCDGVKKWTKHRKEPWIECWVQRDAEMHMKIVAHSECAHTHTHRHRSHSVCIIIIFRLPKCEFASNNPIFGIIRLIVWSLHNTLKPLCAKIGINCVEKPNLNERKKAEKAEKARKRAHKSGRTGENGRKFNCWYVNMHG